MSFRCQNLMIRIGSFSLGPISFSTEDRGLCWLQGSNGAGKTTFLRTILGRLKPHSGQLHLPSSPIGSVGVEGGLIGCWSILHNWNWMQNLLQFKGPIPQELQAWAELRFDQLSQGMKRQVELVFALNLPFPTLLLDEPLSPLDVERRKVFAERIRSAENSKLIFITTHHAEELTSQPKYILNLGNH